MNKPIFLFTLFISSAMFSSLALASGGGGGGGFSRGSYNPPRVTDQNYELGKSIYLGRNKNIPKVKYCVDNGTEKVKVKGSTLKPFKKKSQKELASKLYDCNDPETLIFTKIGSNNLAYAMYYLNKRYKLRLTN